MKKSSRILFCLVLLFVLIAAVPQQVHAAPVPCDARLFLAAQLTAFHDPTPPPLDQRAMTWLFEEGQYRTSYGWQNGIGGYVMHVQVMQGKRVVGVATNGVWTVCHPSNAWRNYLIGHLPPGI